MKMVHQLKSVSEATKHLESLALSKDEVDIIRALFDTSYTSRNITLSDIGSRKRHYVETNAAISNALRRNLLFTLQKIALIMGKNHATIVHYNKLHDDILCRDETYMKTYSYLSEQCRTYVDKYKWSFHEIAIGDSDKDTLIKKLRRENAGLRVEICLFKDKFNKISNIIS